MVRLAFGLGALLCPLQLADCPMRRKRAHGMVRKESAVRAVFSRGVQNVDDERAEGGRMLALVRMNRTGGDVEHIPSASGQPLCKVRLNLLLWLFEERPADEARVCHRCTVMLAKQARSLPFRPS